jgi:hypothetical protein
MSALQQAEFEPVFNWNPSSKRRGVLISCVAVSAILHAFCFYLFQIIYPPTVALLPPPARVNIITPESEDGRVLLRWIEAEDPALSSTTQRPPASVIQPPVPSYVPSFANHIPALRELPPDAPETRIPSSNPPAPVPRPRASVPPTVHLATSIHFAENDSLGRPEIPPLQFTASRNEPPETARFRVAVGEHGEVRHCFIDRSSGDPSLDDQARRYLMQTRFPEVENRSAPPENSLTWTTATVEWGNDFTIPKQPTISSPPP